tara:strand:+ start:369 stop:593 length:225 start_codon:yes stop_codon:yes gene_type:complete
MCANCENANGMYMVSTAVGIATFCSEKCYAEYIGIEVKPEGYYGLIPIDNGTPIEWGSTNKRVVLNLKHRKPWY